MEMHTAHKKYLAANSGDQQIDGIRMRLGGLSRPLEFLNCADIAHDLSLILRGWELEFLPLGGNPAPLVKFLRKKRKIHWISDFLPVPDDWRKDPPIETFYAMCDIRYELSDWFLADNPSYLGVHCAAVQFGDGLVVFPSPVRAGKSTLAIQLCAAGHRVFGDDVLLIEEQSDQGMSLGVLPRIRLPLPDRVKHQIGAFVADREGPKSRRYCYVDLRDDEMAPFGTLAPIQALVLLDRQVTGEAGVELVSESEMLKYIIKRNFAEEVPAMQIFERFRRLTAGADRIRIRYENGLQAIEELQSLFGPPA